MGKSDDLLRLLKAIKDLELGRLAQINAKMNLLTGDILDTKNSLGFDSLPAINAPQPAWHNNVEKWRGWVNQELVRKNNDLLILAAQSEDQKRRSQIALGRARAFEKLVAMEQNRKKQRRV